MLSLFPQLLFLSPLAATLLRIAAAFVFLSLALYHYRSRKELGAIKYMIIGSGLWIPLISATFELIVAVALAIGFYTQLAALLGALGALKYLIWKKRYPEFFRGLSRVAAWLLLVICVSLVVTGAGAFAFDLPL